MRVVEMIYKHEKINETMDDIELDVALCKIEAKLDEIADSKMFVTRETLYDNLNILRRQLADVDSDIKELCRHTK